MRKLSSLSKTTKIVLAALIAVIIVIRLVLPSIILSRLNGYLQTFSPVYSIHIADLDLGFITFSYTAKDMRGTYKKDGSEFFITKRVRVQISLSELLHARILTNVRVDDGTFIITKALIAGSKKPEAKPKESAKKAADTLFPLRISVVDVHDSTIDFSDFVPQESKNRWVVSDIEAKVININPLPANPYSTFFAEGKLLGKSPFKIVAKAKRLEKPLAWKTDIEAKGFPLPSTNPILLHYLPLTFSAGTLDLYSEVKSQNGELSGYVKPFMKDVKVLHAGEEFKSVKHFGYEIGAAFANFMLKRADDKTLATKISFKEQGGHFSVEGGEAALDAIKHGYVKPLNPGIEDSVSFN